MMETHTNLLVYKDLADCYERQGQPSMRDRFLVLAADAALACGLPEEAERLRNRLLQVNPHHLLKPFTSFAQAMISPDVENYVRDLRLNYPLETAESLLRALREPAEEAAVTAANAATARANDDATVRMGAPQAQVYKVQDPDATVHQRPAAPRPLPRQPAPVAPGPRKIVISPPAAKKEPPSAATSPRATKSAAALPMPRKAAPPRLLPPTPLAPREEPGEALPAGAWFSSLLLGVFVAACAAAAVYALGRPFLPRQWLP